MAVEYSVEICKALQQRFRIAKLHRPMRLSRYDHGDELIYDVTGIPHGETAKVTLIVEKFVGGGFAGQVYKVKITNIAPHHNPIEGLEAGGVYAMKILIPPSAFVRLFRNALYYLGFQAPFQLQVNPAAARASALWQKFIRRGANLRFGNEMAVADVYATFIDTALGSCGELSQWIDGRTWRLEVDENMDLLKKWRKGKVTNAAPHLASPEYRAKKQFMADFVKLLHDMGGYEFARQYEWLTCKSQPNCLKRTSTEDKPAEGLTAVDFRAGLVLLPFLPMSPGDFPLIAKGLKRGSLVQFDRGDIAKLEQFVDENAQHFTDIRTMLKELKADEEIYRNSTPDITHNHIRLFYSSRLWSTIFASAVTGWKVRSLIDESHEEKLRSCKTSTLLFFVIGIIPILGSFLRKLWGNADWRRHYMGILTSGQYLIRAFQGKMAEKASDWHRAGRINDELAMKTASSPCLFLYHLLLSFGFVWFHRFVTDRLYARERLFYIFVRPLKLYFNSHLREQWLRDMVTGGKKKNILSQEDADVILSQLKEPFIQKYLKSLAVHVCTLPVTQIVSVATAILYKVASNLTWVEAWDEMLIILAVFQLTPISPGSLVRGFYVLFLVIRERNFKNYNIAVFLAFFKYVGYLAFPIQMTYRYPALARFMAAHWATEAVHIVPVFGEQGALLEHWVFCLFYNWPLTIRRRMRKRAGLRADVKPRYWHISLIAIVAAFILAPVDYNYFTNVGKMPALRNLWWLAIIVPLTCGAIVTLAAGGTTLAKRIASATICGAAAGILYTAVSVIVSHVQNAASETAKAWAIRAFVFAIISTFGAILTELNLPDPDLM
ncbi:MAG: hypothetical protein ACYSSL_01960 [Planctomycetota bacterium]|jgi:hypothetical protein